MGCSQSKPSSGATCAVSVSVSKGTDPATENAVSKTPISNNGTTARPSSPSSSVESVPNAGADSRAGRPEKKEFNGESRSRSTTPTPSLDGSTHSSSSSVSSRRKSSGIRGSTSALGLDKMIDEKRDAKTMSERIVHIEVPFGKPIEEVYNGVHDGPVLGSGISGLVRLATHKTTGLKYAVKCLDLGLVDTEEGLQQLREEIYIMCQLDHPNIVRLEEVYESHSEIYLVQELCIGGELFDRLDEQPDYHYSEAQCARLVKQMLCSVRYIHSKGIIHRDLKLENFLFSDSSPDSELKMIDFGLSKHFKFGEVQHEAVGTPYTVSPEVIRGSYDERCDVWAIGVITYLLLSGESPFGGCGGPEPLMQVRDNILKCNFVFEPADIWDNVSSSAKAFIKRLLVTDPNMRPTAREAQKDPWLITMANRSVTSDDTQLNPSVVKALVNFKEYSDMRKLLCEVLSFTLIPDQIQGLRKEFEKMDTDGSGEISLVALKSVLLGNAAQGSLGALTEEEVEDIFNAMRVSKSETTIHWHEFIAAGLSHCKVDERNLRLAFDRLDADHTGYITFENFMDLIGNGAVHSEEALREMWGEASINNEDARITYEDFLLLMKGQTKPAQQIAQTIKQTPTLISTLSLHPVMETSISEAPLPPVMEKEVSVPRRSSSKSEAEKRAQGGFMSPTSFEDDSEHSSEGPVCMDEDEGTLNQGFAEAMQHQSSGISIKESISIVPAYHRGNSSPNDRARSKSFDSDESKPSTSSASQSTTLFGKNALRAVNLPEHMHSDSKMDSLINDKTKTPLVVNRELYRAHRQMRLAVLEASKRLEEEQQRRAREEMRREQLRTNRMGAGLVMRHGGELSADAIKQLVQKRQQEEQKQVQEAISRTGRRHHRNKTASDIRGMFGNVKADLNNQSDKNTLTLPKKQEESPRGAIPDFAKIFAEESPAKPTPKKMDSNLPELPKVNATKPGNWRKTNYDPFSYGVSKSFKTTSASNELSENSLHQHLDHALKPMSSNENMTLKQSGSDTNLSSGAQI